MKITDMHLAMSERQKEQFHTEILQTRIPAELYAAGADVFAPMLYPMFQKMMCRFQEPLNWKGKMLMELTKATGEIAAHTGVPRSVISRQSSRIRG